MRLFLLEHIDQVRIVESPAAANVIEMLCRTRGRGSSDSGMTVDSEQLQQPQQQHHGQNIIISSPLSLSFPLSLSSLSRSTCTASSDRGELLIDELTPDIDVPAARYAVAKAAAMHAVEVGRNSKQHRQRARVILAPPASPDNESLNDDQVTVARWTKESAPGGRSWIEWMGWETNLAQTHWFGFAWLG